MRERILSSVLLPAPLRPMMPTTSPRFTSKLTSFSAQKACSPLTASADSPARSRRRGSRTMSVIDSRIVLYGLRSPPIWYCLPSPATRMATSLMTHSLEGALHGFPLEIDDDMAQGVRRVVVAP